MATFHNPLCIIFIFLCKLRIFTQFSHFYAKDVRSQGGRAGMQNLELVLGESVKGADPCEIVPQWDNGNRIPRGKPSHGVKKGGPFDALCLLRISASLREGGKSKKGGISDLKFEI
jgi:hypothetical protein